MQNTCARPSLFFINRERDVVRRCHIERELARLPFHATRINAVDGRDLPSWLLHYFPDEDRLSPGEVGCYASHLQVAQIISAEQVPLALVIEDDAILEDDFLAVLREAIENLPPDWNFLHLSGKAAHAVKPIGEVGRHRIVRYSRIPTGTVAYLINFEGARKLLRPMPRRWPFDTDVRQPWQFGLDVYGISPPIVDHDDSLESAILSFGERSRLRRGLHPMRDCVTGNPFKTAASFSFNARKLGAMHWMRCMYVNSARRLSRWGSKILGESAPYHG